MSALLRWRVERAQHPILGSISGWYAISPTGAIRYWHQSWQQAVNTATAEADLDHYRRLIRSAAA